MTNWEGISYCFYKSSNSFFSFFLGCTAWHAGSWFPSRGSNMCPLQRKLSLNHWTAGEVPEVFQFLTTHFLKRCADHTEAFGALDLACGSPVCNFCSSQKLHQGSPWKARPCLPAQSHLPTTLHSLSKTLPSAEGTLRSKAPWAHMGSLSPIPCFLHGTN